jgi:sugar phosphate isomerase/epimerase
MLAFSTCWNSGRHTSGEDMLREIADMGFDHVELSHGIGLPLIEGVLRFQEKSPVKFTTLHNFCPMPVEVLSDNPDCYEFSSSRPDSRQRAVKMTLQTIDYAHRLGAPRIVLHLGTASVMKGFTRDLIALLKDGKFLSKEYAEKKLLGVIEREKLSDAYIDRVVETLKPVIDAAGSKGIRLGVENRDSYESIPSEREFPGLLDRLGPVAGYWHDFGHAQRKENLAIINHAEWTEKIGGRAIGAHLHDCRWPVEDHCAPFTGDIDYHRIVPNFPPDIPFVIEMSPRRERDEILASADRWRKEFGN